MKFIVKNLLVLVLSFCLIFSLCCCGTQEESTTTESTTESTPLSIGIMDWAGIYPWFGIRDTGILEEVGVNVDVKYFPKYSELISAFAAGNLDMVCLSYGDTIPAMSSGLEYKFISVTDCTYGADALVVNKDINSVAELKGKKVATELGTSDHYYLYKILEQNGMTIDDIEFVNLGLTEANAALTSGQVDAVVTLEPFLSNLTDQGYKKLTDSSEMYGIVPCSILAKNDVLTERRDEVAKALECWYKGVDKLNARDTEFIKACAEGAGIEQADFEMYIDIIKFLTPEEGLKAFETSTEYISIVYNTEQWADFFVKEGLIETAPENIEQYLDSSLLEEYINK